MNSGTIFEPYNRNFDPNGRYQGKANYNVILRDIISQPDDAFDEDLFPYHCYCYDSVHNKLSHVGSLSHDANTFTIHSAPVSSDGYLKHFISCVTALGPDMLVGNTERCTPSAFNDRIQYYNPLDVDFSAYRVGFSFLVKNTDTDNQEWVYSIDELKALDSTKNVVVQTAGRLFFKNESTGDWGGFVNNDNSSSIIYNCNDRVLYAKSSARFTGSSGIDVVPHWTMGCLRNGTVVAANAEMNDSDTGYLIAGVVNTVDGEIELPISEKYNFTEDGLVIEVIEDWDNRDRITITTCLSIEQTLKEVAYLGLIVCHYNSATVSVYAGYIDSDGLANGELIPYEDWETTDSLNIKNQFMTDFPDLHIKPKPSPEPTDMDDTEKMEIGGWYTAGGMVNYYALSDVSKLEQLSENLSNWDYVETGKDVLRNLISLKAFPVTLEKIIHKGLSQKEIIIAGTQTGVNAWAVDSTYDIINMGSISIPARFEDFRDYAPYTKIEIFIPFCGWVSLPSHTMGRTVSVKMTYDIIAGTCKAFVFLDDNTIVSEISGVMSVDIPFTAEAVGMKTAGVISGVLGVASSVLGAGVGLATGNIIGTASGAIGVANSVSQLISANNANYTEVKGNTGDANNFAGLKTCFLKITRPVSHIPDNYARTVGWLYNKSETLVEGLGFTVIDNPQINGNMTETERDELKALLSRGVIL